MENKTPNTPNKPTGKMPKFSVSWIYGIIILVLIGSYFFNNAAPIKEVPYSTFEDHYCHCLDLYFGLSSLSIFSGPS